LFLLNFGFSLLFWYFKLLTCADYRPVSEVIDYELTRSRGRDSSLYHQSLNDYEVHTRPAKGVQYSLLQMMMAVEA
jgi:hypothetical protein